MTVIARRIRATPQRGACDAWAVVVDILAPEEGDARRELQSVEGIASSLIATEAPKDAAMVVRGTGPRVRIYCLYDDDAIAGDDASEGKLAQCPTDGDWKMSLPADAEDVGWIKAALAKKSSRITVREKNEPADSDEDQSSKATRQEASIDTEAFFRS